jgi:hypothetical protein
LKQVDQIGDDDRPNQLDQDKKHEGSEIASWIDCRTSDINSPCDHVRFSVRPIARRLGIDACYCAPERGQDDRDGHAEHDHAPQRYGLFSFWILQCGAGDGQI